MAKKNSPKNRKPTRSKQAIPKRRITINWKRFFLPAVLVLTTAICFWPMLQNEFVNWDDEFYVTNNLLIRGPDWTGIATSQVLGNYHPLTMLSYAFNYAISGLEPFSYLLVNYLFHIANTVLVFYFILNISGKNKWVALFVALAFGIHPMHVESVAWVAERKDVLYTFFFLLALLKYWRYLVDGRRKDIWICFVFFLLSLLSKPAAIVLPLVLFLLDYWYGRSFTRKMLLEKIPFFAFSIWFGITTVVIQSKSAMVGLNIFSITDRLLFGCYTLMTYFYRFLIPYPLSAFHPFPMTNKPGLAIMLSPIFIVALLVAFWFLRKSKIFVFGMLFFIVNLLLVLQILSIGLTIVSERYTYVPYIGLAFMLAMFASKIKFIPQKLLLGFASLFIIVMGVLTFQRTKVWRNSYTLWTNALKYAPRAPYARTNRANYLSKLALRPDQKPYRDSLYKIAFEDCKIALAMWPNHAPAFEYRSLMHLDRGEIKEAFDDANELIKLKPNYKMGYDVRGSCYFKMHQLDKSLEDYQKCVQLSKNDHRSFYNMGLIYFTYQNYDTAITNFTTAINLNPIGIYYQYRALSYKRKGDLLKARADAQMAAQKNVTIPAELKPLLQ